MFAIKIGSVGTQHVFFKKSFFKNLAIPKKSITFAPVILKTIFLP